MQSKRSKYEVCFILPSFSGGGAERVSITLLNQLSERDKFPEITLVVFDDMGPLSSLVSKNIKVHVLGRKRMRDALPALAKYISHAKPNIIFSNMAYINQAVLSLKSFLPKDIKYIVREANIPLLGVAGWKRGIMKAGYKILYGKADEVICPSLCVAEALLPYLPSISCKPTVIYNPVNVVGIREHCGQVKRVPGQGQRIVAAGRLTRQKGFDRLVTVMPDLPNNIHLTILGDGPQNADLMKQIANYRLLDRINLKGYVDNPWAYVAGADALVLPSRWEGLPNVALEALACGTKVISTPEAGGINEIALLAPDSVHVADVEGGFASAIMNLECKENNKKMCESLLPDAFSLREVVDRYEQMFLSHL